MATTREVVLVSGVRTAIGEFGGSLKDHAPSDLAAAVVREAVKGRIASGKPLELHYDHPVLMLQHMLWHEGYHHGQIKLALKLAGRPFDDEKAGPLTWRVWMNKTPATS